MIDRPILFNGAMVRAILEGRKTVTRRLVPKWQLPRETEGPHDEYPDGRFMSVAQRHPEWGFGVFGASEESCMNNYNDGYKGLCPYGQPGDRLWVRETFADAGCRLTYRADQNDGAHCVVKRWTPSIHMPRWASRILLEVTDVRVERLQDISEEQAMAEGIHDDRPHRAFFATDEGGYACNSARCAFALLWESINGPESWNANPWVWVVEFKRIEP